MLQKRKRDEAARARFSSLLQQSVPLYVAACERLAVEPLLLDKFCCEAEPVPFPECVARDGQPNACIPLYVKMVGVYEPLETLAATEDPEAVFKFLYALATFWSREEWSPPPFLSAADAKTLFRVLWTVRNLSVADLRQLSKLFA